MLVAVAVVVGVVLAGAVLGLRHRELSSTLRSPVGQRFGEPRLAPLAPVPTHLDSRFEIVPVRRITAAIAAGVAFAVAAGVLALAGVEPVAVLAAVVGILELGDGLLAARRNRQSLDVVARQLLDSGPTGSGPPEASP